MFRARADRILQPFAFFGSSAENTFQHMRGRSALASVRAPPVSALAAACSARAFRLPSLSSAQRQRSFQRQQVVSYPQPIIFRAVAAVEEYTEFLPWCLSSEVLSRDHAGTDDAPTQALSSEIRVGWQMLQSTFHSTVSIEPQNRIHAISEPNEYLEALQFTWTFSPLGPRSCRLDLHLDFCLRNAEHVLMWDIAQDKVIGEYLHCFQRRCAELDKRPP